MSPQQLVDELEAAGRTDFDKIISAPRLFRACDNLKEVADASERISQEFQPVPLNHRQAFRCGLQKFRLDVDLSRTVQPWVVAFLALVALLLALVACVVLHADIVLPMHASVVHDVERIRCGS